MTYGPESIYESREEGEMTDIQDPFGDVTPEEANAMFRNGGEGVPPEVRKLIEEGATFSIE
jgi:hypothetical protein